MQFTQFVINALKNDLTAEQVAVLSAEVEFNQAIDLIGLQKRATEVKGRWVDQLIGYARQGVLTPQGYSNGQYTGITQIEIEYEGNAYFGASLVGCDTAINVYRSASGNGGSITVSSRHDLESLAALSAAIGFDAKTHISEIAALEDELKSNIAKALIA